jgi:hypothetical protein
LLLETPEEPHSPSGVLLPPAYFLAEQPGQQQFGPQHSPLQLTEHTGFALSEAICTSPVIEISFPDVS